LSLGPKSGRQQDRLQLRVAADDLLPDDQAVARVEPTGCRPARSAVDVELATQQFGPRDDIRRLPDAPATGLAGCVVASAQKMGETTGGRDIRRASLQFVTKDDYFIFIFQ
jgi:hypothetical protein